MSTRVLAVAAHCLRAVIVIVAILSAVGCGGTQQTQEGSRVDEPQTQEIEGRPLTLYTHCGVWSANVGGMLWLADPPIHDGSHNPLPGWDQNHTPGTWRDLGNGRAEFRADSEQVAQFVAARSEQKDPAAGCE